MMKERMKIGIISIFLFLCFIIAIDAENIDFYNIKPVISKQSESLMAVVPFLFTDIQKNYEKKIYELFYKKFSLSYKYSISAQKEISERNIKKRVIEYFDHRKALELGKILKVDLLMVGALSFTKNFYHMRLKAFETNLQRTILTVDTKASSFPELIKTLTEFLNNPIIVYDNRYLNDIFIVPHNQYEEYDYQVICYEDKYLYEPIYLSYEKLRASISIGEQKSFKELGKISVYNKYIFVIEQEKGVHIIDNFNSEAPKKIAFIKIPGIVDLAVKDDIIYANSYIDLVLIDISKINQYKIHIVNRFKAIFPYNNNYSNHNFPRPVKEKKGIVIGVKQVGTFLEKKIRTVHHYPEWMNNIPQTSGTQNSFRKTTPGSVSQGGSMARFLIIEDYLYIIDDSNLLIFNISDPQNTKYEKSIAIGREIETIFPYNNKLFIGGRNGMYIYDNSIPFFPKYISTYQHIRMYDPVVVSGDYAFITLRNMPGSRRGGFDDLAFSRSGVAIPDFIFNARGPTSCLDIVDISNIKLPVLFKTISLSEPYGLAVEGNMLVVCDSNTVVIVDINTLSIKNTVLLYYRAYDVILNNGMAIIVTNKTLCIHKYDIRADSYFFNSKAYLIIE